MALMTWEEKFDRLLARVARLELEVPRIYGHIKVGEGLQDNLNMATARRLADLEARIRGAR
jgi:hypothetical protein